MVNRPRETMPGPRRPVDVHEENVGRSEREEQRRLTKIWFVLTKSKGESEERLVIYCRTTSVSAAHATPCATYCTPCRPLIQAFYGFELHLLPRESKHWRAESEYAGRL